jgi:hypothetical protein
MTLPNGEKLIGDVGQTINRGQVLKAALTIQTINMNQNHKQLLMMR